jgi:uncharacterized protein YxeA
MKKLIGLIILALLVVIPLGLLQSRNINSGVNKINEKVKIEAMRDEKCRF